MNDRKQVPDNELIKAWVQVVLSYTAFHFLVLFVRIHSVGEKPNIVFFCFYSDWKILECMSSIMYSISCFFRKQKTTTKIT